MKDEARYVMIKELGKGAFGYVFEAQDTQKNRRVAIKRIEKVGKDLSREYEILCELKDSLHCVNMLECFYTKTPSTNLIQNVVFEFLEDDLEKVITRYTKSKMDIPERIIKLYAYQIFKGLEEIHQKNIVHRDLKPENILKTSTDYVKIADFGSSKFLDNFAKNTPYIVSRYYRAPELLLCVTNYNYKIDTWAAGCILAEMAIKQVLFRGKDEGGQLFEIFKLLGSLNPHEKEYYMRQSPFLAKHIDMIPHYPRDETKLASLYSSFSEPGVARIFFEQIFKLVPTARLSASEALNHRFFADTKIEYEMMMRNLAIVERAN
jgi:serine/threonine protein kinase